jgi:hypothetical protein
MGKRGYFFTIDAFIAMGIMIIGVVLAYLSYTAVPDLYQQSAISNDIMDLFSNTELRTINSRYIDEQIISKNITNTQNTIFEQIGELAATGKFGEAQNMTRNMSYNLIPSQYYYSIWLNGVLLDNKSYVDVKTEQVSASKVILVGSINYSVFWGPYEAEVIIWR